MPNKVLIIYFFFLMAFSSVELKASDWKSLVSFNGNWYFTVGDDPAWSRPSTDISDWDKITAPKEWEHYYPGYNGYAWYRKDFSWRNMPNVKSVKLFLGYIDDVDEVFINGKKVGQTGQFLPHYKTAYNQERQYFIPVSLLSKMKNVIAVRVFDEGRSGGIVNAGKFGFYYDRDQELLELDLSGTWKFSIDNFGNMHDPYTNDENWKDIQVPMNWEQQGFSDYDGRAWYRKRFSLPETLKGEDLYFVLGKIDDFDEVFINGAKVGQTGSCPPHFSTAYNAHRKYPIPNKLIHFGEENLIAVRVYDNMLEGGIVSGNIRIYSTGILPPFAIDLTGTWLFNKGRVFDEYNHKTIQVPGAWENQGYNNYDGYAVYTKKIKVTKELASQHLVLLAGRIDDADMVFINGKLIGQTGDYSGRSSSQMHTEFRNYFIPPGVLKGGEENTIEVRILDTGGEGGILEGPVGIMIQNEFRAWWKSKRRN